jgi:predicted class III extradiol MEMO1 family dioxygenase
MSSIKKKGISEEIQKEIDEIEKENNLTIKIKLGDIVHYFSEKFIRCKTDFEKSERILQRENIAKFFEYIVLRNIGTDNGKNIVFLNKLIKYLQENTDHDVLELGRECLKEKLNIPGSHRYDFDLKKYDIEQIEDDK